MQVTKILDFLGSLRLTVVCLFLAMLVVFFGTLAQVTHGLYAVQKQYFQSFIVFWGPVGADWKIPVMPGGYTVGAIFIVNFLVLQFWKRKFEKSKMGLYTAHAGLVLLLVGQLVTDLMQVESHMRLVEGQSSTYSESPGLCELALVNTSSKDANTEVCLPERLLAKQSEIAPQGLPFQVRILGYYQNSRVSNEKANVTGLPSITEGIGKEVGLTPMRPAARMDERNMPSVVFEVKGPNGSLGTWLASLWISERQSITVAGQTWEFGMRPLRYYKPYSITLIDFKHDKYPGTEIPKNFSSRVKVNNPATKEERETLIYMNNPLRYGGETFYQSSYDPKDERVSILQVVRNPGWLTPYIATLLVGLGLTLHFLIALTGFVKSAVQRRTS